MKDVKFEVLQLRTINELEKHLNDYAPILLNYKIVKDELDCLFEIQNEDCDRSEVSLLFKSLGGDDLINEIKDLTKR